jgi:hypothetical protein
MPPLSGLTLVYSDLQGTCDCIGGEKNNFLTQGLVGSVALAGHWGHCIRDGGAIFIGYRECGALVQEGPPLVFCCRCPPGKCLMMIACLCHSCFYSTFKKWCCSARCRTSLVPIFCRWLVVSSVTEVPGANGTP